MARTVYARPPQKGPIVIPNAGSVKLMWTQNSVMLSVHLGCQLTAAGPLNPTVAETIFSAIKAAAATTTWLTHCHPSLSFVGVHVKDLRAANNPTLASTSAGVPGTGTGTPLSQATALAVTLRTAQSGRGFVGRVYLMGMVSSVLNTAQQFDQVAAIPAAIAFVQAAQGAITTNLGGPVLLQRQLLASTVAGAPPPYNQPRNANTVPITAVNVANPDVDTQRRRVGR